MEKTTSKDSELYHTSEEMVIHQPVADHILAFHNVETESQDEVGRLVVNDEGKLHFEGDATESAAIFFDCVCDMFNDYWERRNMTRNSDGEIVPQCEHNYNNKAGHHVRCILEQNHDGNHRDARGEWGGDQPDGSSPDADATGDEEVPTPTE